jgi:hypothetical protein
MDDWDHERAQDEDLVADEEPHEFGIHGTTVEARYHYAYGLLPGVLPRLCAGVTWPADRQCCCPSVLLRLCAGVTKLADRQCWWLIVRATDTTGELAFHRCYSPEVVQLRELVGVARSRWMAEESLPGRQGKRSSRPVDEDLLSACGLLDFLGLFDEIAVDE